MRPRFAACLGLAALVTSVIVVTPTVAVADTPDDLLISEYIEGSGNNKAVELYNGTGAPVDLSDYTLEQYSNGNTSTSLEEALTGSVADGEVFVFAHSSADPAVLEEADHTTGTGLFNGNDVLVLRGPGGEVVDSLGQIGTDDEWGTGNTSTQDNTLRRMAAVCTGDTDPDDAFDPADEWNGFPRDTFDGLGAHTVDCEEDGGDPGDPGDAPRISELRIDQPGGDDDEYLEVEAPAGTDLTGHTLLAIGDGSGGSGVVESVVDLTGTVDEDEAYVVAEDSFTLGAADQVATLGFENGDNVTHLLVTGSTASNGDDLDTDDDGTLDSTPWTGVVDAIGLVEDLDGGEQFYGAALGFEDIGPDGSFVPGHAYRDTSGAWTIGDFQPVGETDTPGVVPNDPDAVPEPDPTCDATDITPISQVQGDGAASPLEGDTVTVRSAVTNITPQLDAPGFLVQEEPADTDDDPATSEGVHVAASIPDDLAIGDTVEVTGAVSEHFGRTQLDGDEVAVCDDVPTIEIDPTPLALPATPADREAVEGMLVATTEDLYVTGLFSAYEFGELGVAPDGPLVQPTARFAPDDPRADDLAEENANSLLLINDREEWSDFSTEPWFHEVRRRAGDVVPIGTTATMNYSFGDYKLEPVELPEITQVEERPAAPRLDGGNDIGAFNVLNYFNTFGNSDVLRGARSQEQFDLQSAKIVEAITQLDAAVLGLVELENDYEDHYDGDPDTVPAIQTLVEQLNAEMGAGTYEWVVPDEEDLTDEGLGGGGLGTDAIAQGIIYQPARVTPVGDPATFDIDAELQGEDTEKNRWPLAQSFDVDGEVVTVVVNHLKSKGSSCADVDGPTFDPGDDVESPLTANCDLTRQYAARRLVDWIETKPTGVQSPDTLVVGDLNAYQQERPVQIFRDAGYQDTVAAHGGDRATYKFDGNFGRLDHVLASPSAKRLVEDTEVWQANSPEPYGYLYYIDPVESVQDATAYASSDHDPVVVSISSPGRSGGRGGPGGGPGGGPPGGGPPGLR